MKKMLLTTFVLISGLISNNSVEAIDTNTGFYISAIGGVYASAVGEASLLDILDANVQNGFVESVEFDNYDFDLSTGYVAGGSLGYRFCNIPFRIEGEFIYRNNRINNFVPNDAKLSFEDIDLDTNLSSHAYMGNLFYELRICSNFTPYIGVGVGYVQTEHKAGFDKFNVSICYDSFGVQSFVGLNFAFYCKTEASLEYRYLYTHNYAKLQNHGISLNLRRFF